MATIREQMDRGARMMLMYEQIEQLDAEYSETANQGIPPAVALAKSLLAVMKQSGATFKEQKQALGLVANKITDSDA